MGAAALILSLLGAAACHRGTGCPATQQAQTGVDKHGKLSKSRGSSNLFPKEMRRRRH